MDPLWLGLCDYEKALTVQIDTLEKVRVSGVAVCLGLEHPQVITLGKRGQAINDLLASMETLREQGIKIIGTDRGGQATLHNPGQLVIYPIIPLRVWKLGVKDYVECLERATAIFLAEYGLDVTRGYEPGLYVEGKKIAAFGIRVLHGITLHGLAININNDLEAFKLIRQCGQVISPTNLQKEMQAFGAVKTDWNFSEELVKWINHFLNEVRDVNALPLSKPQNESFSNPP
jgi:lipoyl(octanoyl) transferase